MPTNPTDVLQPTIAPPVVVSVRHHWLEDAYALLIGCVLVALGLSILKDAGLATGGVAGLALLLSTALPLPVGVLLAFINIPFVFFPSG